MAITRTYAVGQNGTVRRRDNHAGPWIDISPPSGIGTWLVQDVMADPLNPDKVTIVGEAVGSYSGILTSSNAGITWNIPGGTWDNPRMWYEVWYVNSTTIWAVGESGHVAKSIDGGITFNLTTIIPGSQALTNAIHAISDQVAVVVDSRALLTANTVCKVWKTINGGFSWFLLNGGLNLIGTPTIGYGESIWISDDQLNIIVGTSGTQNISTDAGTTFTSVIPEMTGAGRHLTWYPSHGAPTFFRHVGGAGIQVNESTDTGATFTDLRSGDAVVIAGAHFYSDYNGYYIVGRTIYFTSDGAITGSVSEVVPGVEVMTAVWTAPEPITYILTDCTGAQTPLFSNSPLLSPHVGLVINISVDGEALDTCWQVEVYDSSLVQIINITEVTGFADCLSCLPAPPSDICWDLLSCNGTCDDILSVSGLNFINPPLAGTLWYLNQDPTCVYEVYPVRQAAFINLQSGVYSNPTSDFQLGTDNITFECTSLIYNGVEQVTTPFTYLLSPSNYQVVECTGLNCVIVPVNTTENCIDNMQIFLNNMFTSLGLPLEAYSDDPTNCELGCRGKLGGCLEMFRVQYRDSDIFTISFNTIDNSGTTSGLLDVSSGNVTTQYDLTNSLQFETCNNNVFCPPVSQPVITSIEQWNGLCPEIPMDPVLGEACEITPRLGEPGFSTKHCDPKKVVAIKTSYADSVYALFKRMRYGIATCCEYDLDKIDIKNMLLDLGDIYDPDLCIPGQPVPSGCCPQPSDIVAVIAVPLAVTCPAPTSIIAILEIQSPPCDPPVDIEVVLTV